MKYIIKNDHFHINQWGCTARFFIHFRTMFDTRCDNVTLIYVGGGNGEGTRRKLRNSPLAIYPSHAISTVS